MLIPTVSCLTVRSVLNFWILFYNVLRFKAICQHTNDCILPYFFLFLLFVCWESVADPPTIFTNFPYKLRILEKCVPYSYALVTKNVQLSVCTFTPPPSPLTPKTDDKPDIPVYSYLHHKYLFQFWQLTTEQSLAFTTI